MAYEPLYPHAHCVVLSRAAESMVDYLKQLYPHPRDGDCIMDELTHTYQVCGRSYPCSVSDVVGVFFEPFDQERIAEGCIHGANSRGLSGMESSVYNLVMYLRYGEGLLPGWTSFERRVNEAIEAGRRAYVQSGWEIMWSRGEAIDVLTDLLAAANSCKPRGGCYFFTRSAGCTSRKLVTVWDLGT